MTKEDLQDLYAQIAAKHFDASNYLQIIKSNLDRNGDVTSHAGQSIIAASMLRRAIPSHHDETMQQIQLRFAAELRDAGMLSPVGPGAERKLPVVQEWNMFVAGASYGQIPNRWAYLWKAPLFAYLSGLMFSLAYRRIGKLPEHVTTDPELNAKLKRTDDSLTSFTDQDLNDIATATCEALKGLDSQEYFGVADFMNCQTTGESIHWQHSEKLAPKLGRYDDGYNFVLLEQLAPRKPILHARVKLTSGKLMLADNFRIDGFNEAVDTKNEGYVDTTSQDGAKTHCKDLYERLSLMRIRTANCVPSVTKHPLEKFIRVSNFHEDHDFFWDEEAQKPRNQDQLPEELGRICCDYWAVTFGDRDAIANGVAQGSGMDIDAAQKAVDDYARDEFVTTLNFQPGQEIHVYWALAHWPSLNKMRSTDYSVKAFHQDYFLISETELDIDLDDVETVDWKMAPARPE